MNNQGWIVVHRKLLNSIVFTSEKGLKIWIWCLLKANHKEATIFLGTQEVKIEPGQFVFGRDSASDELAMSPSTVRNWMNILKKDSYIDIKTTNKYSLITIQKWKEYQSVDTSEDNKIKTKKQQNNTNNNVNNDNNELKAKALQAKPEVFGNQLVNLIMETYKRNMGFYPTDRTPRFVANNMRVSINHFCKKWAPTHPQLTPEYMVEKIFTWYMGRPQIKGETLDAVRRKMKMLIEVTDEEYRKEVQKI